MRQSSRRHRQCDQYRNWTFHGFRSLGTEPSSPASVTRLRANVSRFRDTTCLVGLRRSLASISSEHVHGDGGRISSQDAVRGHSNKLKRKLLYLSPLARRGRPSLPRLRGVGWWRGRSTSLSLRKGLLTPTLLSNCRRTPQEREGTNWCTTKRRFQFIEIPTRLAANRTRGNVMVARILAATFAAAVVSAVVLAPLPSARADDLLKVAVAQRGQWDTAITELGVRSGIFKKHGIAVDILYTQGGPEAHQAVISGSMDIACGGGIESAMSGFSKGAPVRIIGSAMIGSPDTYWFVVANSPIKSLADASGKTISYSQNGSSSHTALLALLDQYKVDARPVSTGGHPATLTMVMTGQIDIGRGAAPFGLDLVEQGKIRVIARGSEIKARADQTVRICMANAQVLAKRGDAVARFMQGYRDTIDWMYSD